MSRSKRIAIILEPTSGGVGRHVADLAHVLAKQHHVSIIYSPTRMNDAFKDFIKSEPLIEFTPISMPREVSGGDMRALRDVKHFFAESPAFDVIHAHSSKAGFYVAALPKKITALRVWTPHLPYSQAKSGYKRAIFKQVEKMICRCLHAVIAVSHAEHEHLKTYVKTPLFEIANGIDAPACIEEPKQPVITHIGTIATLDKRKAMDVFLKGFAQLLAMHPHVKAHIVGDGEEREALKELAADLHITQHVQWYHEHQGIDILKIMDVYVHTSNAESFAYVWLEAMASCVPVVATDVGDAALLFNGVGVIMPPQNPASMAQCVSDLITDIPYYKNLQHNAYKKVGDYSIKQMVQKTMKVYAYGEST